MNLNKVRCYAIHFTANKLGKPQVEWRDWAVNKWVLISNSYILQENIQFLEIFAINVTRKHHKLTINFGAN